MSNTDKLKRQLWSVADDLRGKMDAGDYQKYTLPIIFYKFLSDKVFLEIEELFKNDDDLVEFRERKFSPSLLAELDDEVYGDLKEEIIARLGYFVEADDAYAALVKEASTGLSGNWSTYRFSEALTRLENSTHNSSTASVFSGLFDSLDLHSAALGNTPEKRANLLAEIVAKIGDIDFDLGNIDSDALGDAYEYLIANFAESAGKKGGEFYTPQQVSKILAKILSNETPDFKSVYDPTCGSGSLLIRVAHEVNEDDKGTLLLRGQELNATTYNLARMNMILHGVPVSNFSIQNGDTLTDDKHSGEVFDVVSANPPYSAIWKHTDAVQNDPRFAASKLAPKTKADFAFVQHIVSHLDDKGTATIVLPHGVLFRSGAEQEIRKHLIEQNLVHGIIGLPANLFYGTGIATCILVIKKGRKDDEGIFFIDASQEFDKKKSKNYLSDNSVNKIVDTFDSRESVSKYAHLAKLDEVKKNDYSLNIPMYVDVREDDEIVNLNELQKNKKVVIESIYQLNVGINAFISELVEAEFETEDFSNKA